MKLILRGLAPHSVVGGNAENCTSPLVFPHVRSLDGLMGFVKLYTTLLLVLFNSGSACMVILFMAFERVKPLVSVS